MCDQSNFWVSHLAFKQLQTNKKTLIKVNFILRLLFFSFPDRKKTNISDKKNASLENWVYVLFRKSKADKSNISIVCIIHNCVDINHVFVRIVENSSVFCTSKYYLAI